MMPCCFAAAVLLYSLDYQGNTLKTRRVSAYA